MIIIQEKRHGIIFHKYYAASKISILCVSHTYELNPFKPCFLLSTFCKPRGSLPRTPREPTHSRTVPLRTADPPHIQSSPIAGPSQTFNLPCAIGIHPAISSIQVLRRTSAGHMKVSIQIRRILSPSSSPVYQRANQDLLFPLSYSTSHDFEIPSLAELPPQRGQIEVLALAVNLGIFCYIPDVASTFARPRQSPRLFQGRRNRILWCSSVHGGLNSAQLCVLDRQVGACNVAAVSWMRGKMWRET
jgi:hypothetical protein